MNNSLKEQLQKAIRDKKLKITYPKGYKEWKVKFDYFYRITNNVEQTLNVIYGPGGSANDYKGSLYNNSNFNIKHINSKRTKKAPKPTSKSSVFDYIRNNRKGE